MRSIIRFSIDGEADGQLRNLLAKILKKAGWRQPDSMSLGAPLTQKIQARWSAVTSRTATSPAKLVFVDAASGDIQN